MQRRVEELSEPSPEDATVRESCRRMAAELKAAQDALKTAQGALKSERKAGRRAERRAQRDAGNKLQQALATCAVAVERSSMLEEVLSGRESDFNQVMQQLDQRGQEAAAEKRMSYEQREEADRRRWQLHEVESEFKVAQDQAALAAESHVRMMRETETHYAVTLAQLGKDHAAVLAEQQQIGDDRLREVQGRHTELVQTTVERVQGQEAKRYEELRAEREVSVRVRSQCRPSFLGEDCVCVCSVVVRIARCVVNVHRPVFTTLRE